MEIIQRMREHSQDIGTLYRVNMVEYSSNFAPSQNPKTLDKRISFAKDLKEEETMATNF